MTVRVMRIGIMSFDDFRKRTLEIARGDYTPPRDEPKIWFESLKSMAQVLGGDNQFLLRVIDEKKEVQSVPDA